MKINGVEIHDDEAHDKNPIKFPKLVPGRVAHIDADFVAYQCSAQNPKKAQKSFADMCYNADVSIETITRLSGAEKRVLHLTDHDGNKGGRFEHAVLKEYQANRKDRKNSPPMLGEMRHYLCDRYGALLHGNCEADDAMAEAQYRAIKAGREKLSVICTRDKDLMMVPGLHLDWKTGVITRVKGFGKIWLDDKKKLRGEGTKFFFAQMLMGDPADNISGVPKVGSVKAFELLNPAKNDKQAAQIVMEQYVMYDIMNGFKDQAGNPVKASDVFLSEGKLLWMRRKKNDPDDFKKWLKEIMK